MTSLTLRVNEVMRAVETDDPDMPLLYVLRNDLGPFSVDELVYRHARPGREHWVELTEGHRAVEVVANPPGG